MRGWSTMDRNQLGVPIFVECSSCGESWHVQSNAPLPAHVCDDIRRGMSSWRVYALVAYWPCWQAPISVEKDA